jgi:DNA-binding NtrC family response regulator
VKSVNRGGFVLKNTVLIVGNEAGVRENIRGFLELNGYEIIEAETGQEALGIFHISRPNIVISDYWLSDGEALTILPHFRGVDPGISFIILTRNGSIELAVRAIKAGVDDILTTPVNLDRLSAVLQGLIENQRKSRKELTNTANQCAHLINPFLGTSQAIRQLAQSAEKLVFTESPILIQGETGTGKGVLAAWFHRRGPRKDKPMVDFNCASLSQELLETELFGHEKGAFTGAVTTKMGLFEIAHNGTIFLDEIGDMDMNVQPKLLKVLEEKRFRRLGNVRERQVDIRLITATHKDLYLHVKNNRFRQDLYFRINTLPIRLPSLKERVEDIPILARHLLKEIAIDLGRDCLVLSPDMEKALQAYSWPGNIRELRNVLERAALLSEHQVLTSKSLHIDRSLEPALNMEPHIITLSQLERQHIEKVLRLERGHVEETAKMLGVSKSALYEKIKRYDIKYSEFRNPSSDSGQDDDPGSLVHFPHSS